jgi:hypothetical protein
VSKNPYPNYSYQWSAWIDGETHAKTGIENRAKRNWGLPINQKAYNEGYDSVKGETQMTNKVTVKTCAQEPVNRLTVGSIPPGTIFTIGSGSYLFIKTSAGTYVRLYDGQAFTPDSVSLGASVTPVEKGKCVEIQVQ